MLPLGTMEYDADEAMPTSGGSPQAVGPVWRLTLGTGAGGSASGTNEGECDKEASSEESGTDGGLGGC